MDFVVFPGGPVVKNLPVNAGDRGSIPGLRRSSGGVNGNPLQYFCLENSMDRGPRESTVHGVTKSRAWLTMRPPPHTHKVCITRMTEGRSQDGRGIGRGDHFLPYQFIKRTFECWANFTKQLLTATRWHQAPRKAAHCLWKKVEQKIKDKKRDKRSRDRDPSQEGSLSRGSFQTQETLSLAGLGKVFESRRAT